ncbi:MAG: ATP-binding protein [Pseudomonadota bacterium]
MTDRRRNQMITAAAVILGVMSPTRLFAQTDANGLSIIDPIIAGAAGAVALAVAMVLWAFRVAAASRSQTVTWTERLASMEAKLEKSESVISAHPGLVLVWEDDGVEISEGWGNPKILGGPAALASLLSFAQSENEVAGSPVDRLLQSLSTLPLKDPNAAARNETFEERVRALRSHGIAFSGAVYTADGRAIEADGRIAGGQVTLWLTDPAVRMAEDGAIVGTVREQAADLHGSHKLLERAPMPAWRRDANLNLVWVNRSFADTVEAASTSEVISEQIELDPAARRIATAAANEQTAKDGRIAINAGGERRVIRVCEIPMHSAGDATLGGFAIDISALDKAQDELQQHIEANRKTLDQIPSAVVVFGPNQNLVYHNASFQNLWRLDDADLAGRAFHGEILDRLRHAGLLPEQPSYDEWKARQLEIYTGALAAPGSERYGSAPDEVWSLPDGRSIRVAQQRHPLGGVIVVFEDITEKMDLEAQFNTQLRVHRATLNNLAEGVAVYSANGSLELHNKAFEQLWRLSGNQLSAAPHIDETIRLMSQRVDDAAKHFEKIKKCVTSKSFDDREPTSGGILPLKDGRTFEYGSEPLPDGATLIRFLDITDSTEREKELQERNAILEDADRLKSKFVDHVSYQLRTPLSSIIGFSEMLDGQMFGVLNERQQDYITSVLSGAYHLRDLINDIIDLAAIDAGKMELARSDADIRGLLESAATYSALKAEDTQVALQVDCPRDIGSVSIDERRIKQVLFNLLSNAFAYSAAGGKVTLGADRKDNVLRIWVSDSGRGISPKDQAKAFDAFESSGPGAGAGLGLSLVERFVRLHDGWVKLESQEGAGSKVTCFLPEKVKAKTGENPSGKQPAKSAVKATKSKKSTRRKRASSTRSPAGGGNLETVNPRAAE